MIVAIELRPGEKQTLKETSYRHLIHTRGHDFAITWFKADLIDELCDLTGRESIPTTQMDRIESVSVFCQDDGRDWSMQADYVIDGVMRRIERNRNVGPSAPQPAHSVPLVGSRQ